MNTKFAIKILSIKDEYNKHKEEEDYYYEVYQSNKQKRVSIYNIERAKKFQSSRNAKVHLKKLIEECVNIDKNSGYIIVEVDEQYNIISRENVNVQKLFEEIVAKNPQYRGIEYYVDKLNKVMLRLHVTDYDYNWDKDSAYIKFTYKGEITRQHQKIN